MRSSEDPSRDAGSSRSAGSVYLAPDAWLGTVRLNPQGPIVAGSMGTYTFTYRVGRFGIDNGGTIKIAIRHASDWGRPQVHDPQGEGYTTVRSTGRARLRAFFDPRGFVRPFNPTLVVEVSDEALAESDEVVVVWGDTSRGSPGCRAQTFADPAFEFRVLVDCFGTQEFRRLPSSPVVEVIPGQVERLVLVAPSIAGVGDSVAGILRAEDRFGNPVPGYKPRVSLAIAGTLETVGHLESEERGIVRWSGVRFQAPGTYRLLARTMDGRHSAQSNPIWVKSDALAWRLYWGDTQGQSGETIGTGDLDSFFRFAHDVAALDFVVHSANDFQVTDAYYQAIREVVRRYHRPGEFVTFLSYEWSGNTPAGGDHNIIYLRDDDAPLHRSSQWQLPNPRDDGTDRYPISALWETLRGHTDVMAIPHIGGRYANLDFFDPEFCSVLEITSVHGRFDWFAKDALARSLRVGFVGASDDHSGRPGASAPTAQPNFGHHGGLTAVYATSNIREAIWEALRARRCYATTGPRILLWTEIAGQLMGSECDISGPPRLRVWAAGTSPLEWIEILRDTEVVHRRVLRPQAQPGARRLRVAWSGARIRGRGRSSRWDGSLRVRGASIRAAFAWGFETPGQGILFHDERDVRWRSTTSGDPDGVELDIDAPQGAVLTFETDPATFSLPLGELEHGSYIHVVGDLDQQVEVSWVSTDLGPMEAFLEWEDSTATVGTHAYWVRLLQTDTHAAWTSPIFVTVEMPAK